MSKFLLLTALLQSILISQISYAAAIACPSSYFFDVQHCQTCSPNCICTSKDGCDSCIPGYTMFRNTCIQCPQSSGIYGTCTGCCSRTQGTILGCTDCNSVANYYSFLFSGRCIQSAGCFQVDSNGFCLYCQSKFYQKDNQCFPCHASCSTCADSDNCLTCAAGYYWKIVDYGLCSACPTGCSTCKNDSVCTSCLNRYYFYNDHCLQCPANCLVCVDGSTCTKCSSGILVSNLCIDCVDTTYGGSAGCLACQQSNNFVKCTNCSDLYFLDITYGVCRQCSLFIPGAARCRDQKTPTQCLNDYDAVLTNRYYLVGISCIRNSKSCRKISDIYANCSSCYSGYTLTSGSCVQCPFTGCLPANSAVVNNICTCTLCASGYYLTGVTCTPCTSPNCAICGAVACTACKQGFYLSGSNCLVATVQNCLQSASAILCSICVTGYYKGTDQLCYLCQQNCLQCSSRFTCTKCAPQTSLIDGVCVSYPSNCVQVLQSGSTLTCTLCSHGYFLLAGVCVACSVQLGTLSLCDGYCPIDYYIKNLMVQVTVFQTNKLVTILILTIGLLVFIF